MLDIFDCGARGGPHRSWQDFGLPIRYIAFEPEPEEQGRLEDNATDFQLAPYALGAKNEERLLNVYEQGDLSSFYQFNGKVTYRYDDNITPISSISLPCVTIESYADQRGLFPKFLNIDAQGASLEIIAGAGKYLNEVLAIRCEVELVNVYDNAPKFEDVLKFMRDREYSLIRIETCGPGNAGFSTDMNKWSRSRNDALPMWGDAIFVNVRKMNELISTIRNRIIKDVEEHLVQLAYLATFCIHNGTGYYAMDIFDSFEDPFVDWLYRLPHKLQKAFISQVKLYLDQPMNRRSDVPGQAGYGKYTSYLEDVDLSDVSSSLKEKISSIYNADQY